MTEHLNRNKCILVEYVIQQGFLYCLGLLYDRVLYTLIEMLYGILLGYIIWICSLTECHMKVSMYALWACHMQLIYISAMGRIRQTGQKKKKKKFILLCSCPNLKFFPFIYISLHFLKISVSSFSLGLNISHSISHFFCEND